MAASNETKQFVSYVVELMQSIGPVYAKSMFGGYGIFLDGLMLAIITDNSLYFKADKQTAHNFIDRDLDAFSYHKKDRQLKMSYFQAPEETLEDTEEMFKWATAAYACALRAAAKKIKRKRKETRKNN